MATASIRTPRTSAAERLEETCLEPCPIERGMRLIGGKWKGSILWHLKDGPVRFNSRTNVMELITTSTEAAPTLSARSAPDRLAGPGFGDTDSWSHDLQRDGEKPLQKASSNSGMHSRTVSRLKKL